MDYYILRLHNLVPIYTIWQLDVNQSNHFHIFATKFVKNLPTRYVYLYLDITTLNREFYPYLYLTMEANLTALFTPYFGRLKQRDTKIRLLAHHKRDLKYFALLLLTLPVAFCLLL